MYINPDTFKKVAEKMEIDLEINEFCYIANFDDFEIFIPHQTWGEEIYKEEGYLQIGYCRNCYGEVEIEDFLSEDALNFIEALVVAKLKDRWENIKNNSRQ